MDFDLLIVPDAANARALMNVLRDFGFGGAGITESAFVSTGTAITLGAQPNQIDLLTSMGSRSPSDIVADAETGEIGGLTVRIVSFEDLLRAKRESARLKDRLDAEELERIRATRATNR